MMRIMNTNDPVYELFTCSLKSGIDQGSDYAGYQSHRCSQNEKLNIVVKIGLDVAMNLKYGFS